MSRTLSLSSSRLPGADTGGAKRGPGSVVSVASSTATEDCQCICNICTCGQHHCPKPVAKLPFTGASTYQEDFPSYPVCPQHGPVPMQWQPSSVPFTGTSEAASAYTPKALPTGGYSAADFNPPQRPKVPFTGSSTYKADFVEHAVCPLHAPPGYDAATAWKPSGIKFDGTSTSREAFTAKPLEARPVSGPFEYKPSPVPFAGTSEARSQYQRWELPAREGGDGSAPSYSRPHIPFDGTSTSREAFTAKPLEPRGPVSMPEYRPSSVPFAGTSEAREQYKAWELPAREGGDVDWAAASAARPHIPFDAKSTSQADYTAKPLERSAYTGGAPPAYNPVRDGRDFTSESRAAHGWKEPEAVCPAALLPPAPPASAGTWKQGHAMWDPVHKRWLHNH